MEAITESWRELLPLLIEALTTEGEAFEERLRQLAEALEGKHDVGRVVLVEEIDGYGLTVLLDHGGGWQSLYAHLLDSSLREGDLLRAADQVGRVGADGVGLLLLGGGQQGGREQGDEGEAGEHGYGEKDRVKGRRAEWVAGDVRTAGCR